MSSTAKQFQPKVVPRADVAQPKPNGICQASIHDWNGRKMVCVEMWFSEKGLEKVAFWEPSTDKINHVNYDEVVRAINGGTLVLHQPGKGRLLK